MPAPVLAETSHEDGFAAPLFGLETELDELALHALGVGARLVDLVDGDDDRHLGALGVGDRFLGLRHHAVVGRDDQDDDVGHRGAAGAHRVNASWPGVSRKVIVPLRRLHPVGADVLRDAARFAAGDVGRADSVEQRGLAVVDVTHDRDDRGASDRVPRRSTVFDLARLLRWPLLR